MVSGSVNVSVRIDFERFPEILDLAAGLAQPCLKRPVCGDRFVGGSRHAQDHLLQAFLVGGTFEVGADSRERLVVFVGRSHREFDEFHHRIDFAQHHGAGLFGLSHETGGRQEAVVERFGLWPRTGYSSSQVLRQAPG